MLGANLVVGVAAASTSSSEVLVAGLAASAASMALENMFRSVLKPTLSQPILAESEMNSVQVF